MDRLAPTRGPGPRPKPSSLAKPLAPEDVRPGDFVAVLDEICELPSFLWHDGGLAPRDQLVRLRVIPPCDAVPLRVRSVCLPFVLVKLPGGRQRTLDVRRTRLARLAGGYARLAWKAYKRTASSGAGE